MSLRCERCKSALTINSVLENASCAWYQGWVGFACPHCHTFTHAFVRTGSLEVGYLDGVPGPNFVCTSVERAADLKVNSDTLKLTAFYQNREYVIPVK